MNKFKLIISAFTFLVFATVNASAVNIGISGAIMDFDGDGTEKVAGENSNTGSASETVGVPSIFIETESDSGWVFGIDYIPVGAEFVSESKSQTNITSAASATETLTQKVEGDLDNHITFYVETPAFSLGPTGVFLKAGVISVDVTSNESIGTGSTYGNDTIFGTTVGLGFKGDLPGNAYYKLEAYYSDYETIELSATNTTNSVTGDIDAQSAKLSIGYRF